MTIGGGMLAEPQVSVSIGLVSHPEDGLSAEELMAAADRAMYQAKSLGKNQISGNPRPRPALLARRSTLEEPPTSLPPSSVPPGRVAESPSGAAAADVAAVPGPRDDRAVAVELGPVVAMDEPEVAESGIELNPDAAGAQGREPAETREAHDDSEPDAEEVRRRIAVASRSFDPDHQIRRAMDAFFSPSPSAADRDQPREL